MNIDFLWFFIIITIFSIVGNYISRNKKNSYDSRDISNDCDSSFDNGGSDGGD